MQRKSIFTILGVMLAVVVTSLALVFTVGPKLDAAVINYGQLVLEDEDDFVIDENGVLYGIASHYSCSSMWYDVNTYMNFSDVRIKIPDCVKKIEGGEKRYGTFTFNNYIQDQPRISELILPDGLEEIGDGAFRYFAWNTNYENFNVPEGVQRIGNSAFASYGQSINITIPINVSYVGCDAFNGIRYGNVVCECSEEFANNNWDADWKRGFYGAVQFLDLKKVTFNSMGGDVIPMQKGSAGFLVSEPINPTLENYVFQYWYASDENTPFDFENEQVTDNMTLTAKWEAVASQNNGNDNENQNNNETTNHENANNGKKFNPVMAWIGGGIAAGLSVICGAAIVVAKKRRK